MQQVLLLALYLITPWFAQRLSKRERMSWLDPVVTCYAVGIILGNSGIDFDTKFTELVTEAAVPLAIPLLLFRTDVARWVRSGRSTLLGFVAATLSVIVAVACMSFAFAGARDDIPTIAGLLVGTWTGGTPNLFAIGAAMNVAEETLVLTNAADLLVGGIYLALLLTVAKPLLSRFLPAPVDPEPMREDEADGRPLTTRLVSGALSFLGALAIVAGSAGLTLLIFGELLVPWVILGISSGGVAASFWRPARESREGWVLGNYLILVFCTAIGALTNLFRLAESGSIVLGFTVASISLVLVLHYTLCKLFRVDVDTAIITSVATVMGPPLVAPIAGRLDNHNALVSGITTGLVGYAVGNYLGIGMAHLVAMF